jgi:hypothetical protein
MQGRDRDGRKEKGVTNEYKSLLITEKCKNVHKGNSHSVSWGKRIFFFNLFIYHSVNPKGGYSICHNEYKYKLYINMWNSTINKI